MQSKWKKIIAVLMIAVFVLSGCGSIGEKKNVPVIWVRYMPGNSEQNSLQI